MKWYYKLLLIAIFACCNFTVFAQCDFDDPTPIKIGSVVADPAACPSGGVITINGVTGGGGQYVYEIISGPVIRIIQSQNVFSALPAGSYRIRVSGCDGSIIERNVFVSNAYATLQAFWWQMSLAKQSGLLCGNTNDGVYKLSKPSSAGGSPPYRFQLSTTSNFSSVPFEPGFDSALFTGLNANTNYFVRITDACNNFVTLNFLTPPSTPATTLSVPRFDFQRAYFYGNCTGRETIYLHFRDSATGGAFNVAKAFSDKALWGNRANPYLRLRIEDAVNGDLYADRHISVTQFGAFYYVNTDNTINGETGLSAPGVGKAFAGLTSPANTMPSIYATSTFPHNANLKITIFFPGGDHCGTIVPAYSRTQYYNLGTSFLTQPRITAITPNCNTGGNFFRVDFNVNYAGDTICLVKINPGYEVLKKYSFNSGANYFTTISYSPLEIGGKYRIIIKDSCGRTDSMQVTYTPGGQPVSPPTITDESRASFRCPAVPADTVYRIYLRPIASGYNILSVTIDGIGSVPVTAVPNWNNTSQTGFLLDRRLPPGTYTYRVNWLGGCQTGTVVQSITILPQGAAPDYSSNFSLSISTTVGACGVDGYTAINVNGWLRNGNTNYTLQNLKLTAVPNEFVFPVETITGSQLSFVNSNMYLGKSVVGDTTKITTGWSGIKVKPGQEGTYTISIDIICPDGNIVQTISRTITVSATTPATPSFPDLKYTNALICDAGGSELKINLLPVGGRRPFTYEYKRDTSSTYMLTSGAGTDSVVEISPAPPAGTVYDLRVTDACGSTATNKVTVASFTGRFFIYEYPLDCVNNPFNVRVGTSFINGAYYTWKRNGTLIAQGTNVSFVTVTGVTTDSISVEVNIFDCYSRSGNRMIIYTNPCNYTPLPVFKLNFNGRRLTAANVLLDWSTENEQDLSHYEIEKSYNAIDFQPAGRVSATNQNSTRSYQFNDPEQAAEVFYRLKIVDKRGSISYSPIVRIENTKLDKAVISVQPNPAVNEIFVRINTDKAIPYKGRLFNEKGQLIREIQFNVDDLIDGKKVDVSTLPAGTYILSLVDTWDVITTAKFIKQ